MGNNKSSQNSSNNSQLPEPSQVLPKKKALWDKERLILEGPSIQVLVRHFEWYMNNLKRCIERGKMTEKEGKDLLAKYIQELCQTQVILQASAQGSLICHKCRKYKEGLTRLGCMGKHHLCYLCFKSLIREASGGMFGDSLYDASCPLCKTLIPPSVINSLFGNNICKWNKLAHEKRERPKFTCGICQDECLITDGITLDCDHRYCQEHLKDYLENLIKDGRVDSAELCCPECKEPIHYTLIQRLISAEQDERLIRFRIEKGEELGNEVVKYCPFCDKGRLYIPHDLDEFICPLNECQKSCCPQCNFAVHKGKTCEELAREKRSAVEEENFQKYMAENQMKKCPHCGVPVFRESGCNYMTCSSNHCQRKKFFCMICGQSLVPSDHFTHFKKNGVFGKTCNTIDNV